MFGSKNSHQSNLPLLFLGFVIVLGQFSCSVESLRFELQSGGFKCIAEDLRNNDMTVGKYNVTNLNEDQPLPDSLRVVVQVISPKGKNYLYESEDEGGQFSFVAMEGGNYMTCFSAANHNPQITFTVDFDWRVGVKSDGWSKVAKRSKVDLMVLQLKYLQETVSTIHDEMFYLRTRGEEDEELGRETNNQMYLLSFLSLFICLSIIVLQLWLLKTFFEKKKII